MARYIPHIIKEADKYPTVFPEGSEIGIPHIGNAYDQKFGTASVDWHLEPRRGVVCKGICLCRTCKEDRIATVLEHEVIHQVLTKEIGSIASYQFEETILADIQRIKGGVDTAIPRSQDYIDRFIY